jgi:hypothetical protein
MERWHLFGSYVLKENIRERFALIENVMEVRSHGLGWDFI